jgi:hypothetical protein
MRWMGWSAAMVVVAGLAAPGGALAAGGGLDVSCTGCGHMAAFGSEACVGPGGYSLSPGCCECPPCACDNAWDGYCEQKAHRQEFWTRFGTRQPSHGRWAWNSSRHCTECMPVIEAGSETDLVPMPEPAEPAEPASGTSIKIKPLPPVEPAPPESAAPQQSTWKWRLPGLR